MLKPAVRSPSSYWFSIGPQPRSGRSVNIFHASGKICSRPDMLPESSVRVYRFIIESER